MREQLRAAHSRSYREFLEYRFYGAEGQNRTVDTSLFRADEKRDESNSCEKTSVQRITFCVITKQGVADPGARGLAPR